VKNWGFPKKQKGKGMRGDKGRRFIRAVFEE